MSLPDRHIEAANFFTNAFFYKHTTGHVKHLSLIDFTKLYTYHYKLPLEFATVTAAKTIQVSGTATVCLTKAVVKNTKFF